MIGMLGAVALCSGVVAAGGASDGDTALLGAPGEGAGVGGAHVSTRSGSTWRHRASLKTADEAAKGAFGFRVALSGDGRTARASSAGAWRCRRAEPPR